MPVVPASSRSKPSSKAIKPSSKADKPLNKATKPSSNVVKSSTKDIKPSSKTAQAKSAQSKGPVHAVPKPQAQQGAAVPLQRVLAPKDTNKSLGRWFPMPQTSDAIEPEDLEDHAQEVSENEGQDFEEGDESANELGFGSEDDVGDESKSENEGEGGNDDEDGNKVGQKCRKKNQVGPRKKRYRHGYSKRQNWVLNMCHTIGKLIPRTISLFTPVDDIMWAGAKHSNKAIVLKIDIKDLPYTTPNEKSFSILTEILEHGMTIWEALGCFPKTEIGMTAMIKEFHLGIKESRGTDTNKVQYNILTLCLEDLVNNALTLPKPAHKTGQGFNHIDTGHLLCPQIYLEKFNKSDRFLYDLANGKVKVTASEWPSFLYDQALYDPEDEEKRLMRGFLLLHVYLHIFCSNGDPTKQIAYVACQGHYALSSKDGWTEQDGAFDLPVFYNSIVDLFESHPDDEWALETLTWWNEQVFGDPNGCTDTDKSEDIHPPESTVVRMAARREARAKAWVNAATAAAIEDATLEYDDDNAMETN
ncbi:uncharacterized protein EV420DRAFT_1639258 [Desarmillaria tabescens]|uniref:Fungal-type protein kinase domain-containing protein n=1 Tax=Armillaria tabescens TaxID=1929756 RepID=A0AA39NCS5_ARMTA|nr:uncharacterized protein EV420DRAFT_1639258 [Desarmillaria tabescens]KAK0463159.1 hypothetical protein EV420DRAFT_1639258 [Desarmillaria tabescens]